MNLHCLFIEVKVTRPKISKIFGLVTSDFSQNYFKTWYEVGNDMDLLTMTVTKYST